MAGGSAGAANLGGFIIPIAFLVIFYIFAIRPQKKREKEIREMRDSLRVGDKIITIGGIYGKVLKVKEDMLTIEVGSNKTKIDITKWAVGSTIVKGKEPKETKETKEEKEENKDTENEE